VDRARRRGEADRARRHPGAGALWIEHVVILWPVRFRSKASAW
jgi:hypothetical protein